MHWIPDDCSADCNHHDHRQEYHDMGDNTIDQFDYISVRTGDFNNLAVAVANYHPNRVDSATLYFWASRVVDNHPPAHVDDRAAALDRVYDFAVARARYHNNPTRDNLDRCNADADALIAWDDTHTDAAGDEVRKRRVPPPPPPPLFSTRCSE